MSEVLELAGRRVDQPLDRALRYCGCPQPGGALEVWAWQYFDEVPSPNRWSVTPVDVLAAAALHPGLSREDLTWFVERRAQLGSVLEALPMDVDLADATEDVRDVVVSISTLSATLSLSLLSKVLHHCRPRLVPIVDRHVLDRYRPVTGERTAQAAWRPLIAALAVDTAELRNRSVLGRIADLVEDGRGVRPSELRVVDIVVWMEGR